MISVSGNSNLIQPHFFTRFSCDEHRCSLQTCFSFVVLQVRMAKPSKGEYQTLLSDGKCDIENELGDIILETA